MSSTLSTLVAEAVERSAAGDHASAVRAYREAVTLAPDRADLWHNLGVLCAAIGAYDEALAAFERAARLRLDWADPWHARGHVLHARSDDEGARAAFEAALSRDPSHVVARVNLALTLNRLQRYSEALPHWQKARAQAPTDEKIWWLTRNTLLLLRKDEQALDDFLRFEPHASPIARAVPALWAARRMGDAAREARALAATLSFSYAEGYAQLVAQALGLVQYHDVDRASLLALYQAYDRIMQSELASTGDAGPLVPATPRLQRADARVRIGYLSADFRDHVMGQLLAPVLASHDRARFSIRLYSLAPAANEDALTERFRGAADAFVRLADDDDRMAARKIAADDLDVLVDLMSHSAFSRPGIVARKPARVIVTHLGYHGALGLSAVDYKMTDAIADASGNDAFQIERLLPLSTCVMPLRPYRAPVPRTSRAALDIADDAIVCAAFVGVQKLSPRCLALWRAFLDAAPRAVLLFSPQRDDDRVALLRRLAGFDIDRDRIRFIGYDESTRHDRYAVVDLALDTLPYSGGDTTVAALSAGVPVVTRSGTRHAERMSASILIHAGLHGLVGETDARFVELASRLAMDAAFRAEQCAAIRSALCDPARTDPAVYARALESAYSRALDEKHLAPIRTS
jgi:predicted O-linked N-acetylglucosamine transferase (SPINDLY family)